MYYNAALFNDITPVATSFDFGDFFPDPVVVIPSDPWPTSQSVTIVVAAGDTAGLMEALLELDVSDILVMAALARHIPIRLLSIAIRAATRECLFW